VMNSPFSIFDFRLAFSMPCHPERSEGPHRGCAPHASVCCLINHRLGGSSLRKHSELGMTAI
jgi:hypothetical protein